MITPVPPSRPRLQSGLSSQLDRLEKARQGITRPGTFLDRISTASRLEKFGQKVYQPATQAELMRISSIHSPDGVIIDHTQRAQVEKGDICQIETETYTCTPASEDMATHELTIVRMNCRDRTSFDSKFFECDQLRRFATSNMSLSEYSFLDAGTSESQIRVHIGHPNIVTLYSFWSEDPPANNPYIFKTVVMLLEKPAKGTVANVMRSLYANCEDRSDVLKEHTLLYWAACLLRALTAFHSSGIFHGGITPNNIFIGYDGSALLGPPCKTELESGLKIAKEASKLMIGSAIPNRIVYWAPELLKYDASAYSNGRTESSTEFSFNPVSPADGTFNSPVPSFYGQEVDLWALGVSLYEIATGKKPFPTNDEDEFRTAVLSGSLDLEPLQKYPTLGNLIKNLIRITPRHRWTASQGLLYLQNVFAIPIQRRWRAYDIWKHNEIFTQAATVIQATFRRYYYRQSYKTLLSRRRDMTVSKLQALWRAHKYREEFDRKYCAYLIITRWAKQMAGQVKDIRIRKAAIVIQAVFRRIKAQQWATRVLRLKNIMRSSCADLRRRLVSMEPSRKEMVGLFIGKEIPVSVQQYLSVEDYDILHKHDKVTVLGCSGVALPILVEHDDALESLQKENERLRRELAQTSDELGKATKKKHEFKSSMLEGPADSNGFGGVLAQRFYKEYKNAVLSLQEQYLKRVKFAGKAHPLALRLCQTQNTELSVYEQWERTHDPENRMENVIDYDTESASEYRKVTPQISVELCDERGCPTLCLVSAVRVVCGSCPSKDVVVSVADYERSAFVPVGTFALEDTAEPQTLVFKDVDVRVGEALMNVSTVRFQFRGNHRGGNISAVKKLFVLGVEAGKLLAEAV